MKKISCKMKNSFAIDNNEILYSWGSYESGLLGREDEVDSIIPKPVELKDGHDIYTCESVSSNYFHVAVVANRKINQNVNSVDTKFAYKIIDNLTEWYRNVFIKKLSSLESLIQILLMYDDGTNDLIKYEDLEKYILMSFFSYQMLNKKDFYNMRAAYKEIFSPLLNMSPQKMFFQIKELVNIIESNPTSEIKELRNFLKHILEYLRDFPEDFGYFILYVLRYEKEISEEILLYLFQYQNATMNEQHEDKKLILRLFGELKGSNNKVNSNLLIEIILKKSTGSGVVFTWGAYSEARLGYKNLDEYNSGHEIILQKTPKIVKFKNPFIKITKISCGYSHSLALTSEGKIYSWGSCKYGCLGNSNPEDITYPQPILIDYDKKPIKEITEIAAGMYFSLALTVDKLVYSWGCGTSGRLGHGEENSVSLPKLIMYFKYNDIKIIKISAGDTHCAVITATKNIYTWGNGCYGKLGHGGDDDIKLPMFVEYLRNKKLDTVVCGSFNTIATTTDNKMFGWGKNSDGALGIFNKSSGNIYIPLEIIFQKEDSNVIINNISLGNLHSLFLGAEGSLYTCGRNSNGLMALNEHNEIISNPTKIPNFTFFKTIHDDVRVKTLFENYTPEFTIDIPKTKFPTGMIYVTCSSSNTAFISNKNDLYMAGDRELICDEENQSKNKKDQSLKQEKYKVFPIKVRHKNLIGKVTYISIGTNHVICVSDNKAYSWGNNICGVLGLRAVSLNEKVNQPCLIEKISSHVRMTCVSDTHTMIQTTTGEVYACGSNIYGKLGVGETKFTETMTGDIEIQNELEPKIVKCVTVAEYIACSNHHSACIMKYSPNSGPSYAIYTWGGGYSGKLGHLDGKDYNIPMMIETLEQKSSIGEEESTYFMQLALGSEFSIALDTSGNMWGWGKIKYLGMNVKDEGIYLTPKLIHKDYKFKHVSCSSSYTLALDKYGTIYGWGKTFSINDKSEFQSIHLINCDKTELVACGINHFAVIDNQMNTPFTWGNNLFYKCGQTFARPGDSEYSFEQRNPKKIQYFYDKFLKNHEKQGKERQPNSNSNDNLNDKYVDKKQQLKKFSLKNEFQLNILEEPLEMKNFGILCEDYKINLKFYQILKEFFDTMKQVNDKKSKKQIEAENSIISFINKTNCKKNSEFISEIPKIISKNFQLYEAFLTILFNHPCYFLKVKKILANKYTFLELVKTSFGGSRINLKNKRIIFALTGLWNSIFKEETNEDLGNNLKDTDRYEDFITYDLYYLIFNLDKENENVVYDLISELFILLIHEILKNSKDFVDPSKDKDILLLYKELPELRKELFIKVVTAITNYMKVLFSDMKDKSKNNFSSTIQWILKTISKLFPINNKNQSILNLENHCKIFNYFLFVPFVEFLRKIKDNKTEKVSKESQLISKKIPEVLEKLKKKGNYTELYNIYKTNNLELEKKHFSLICSSKSSLLSFLYDIFNSLSKYEKFEFTNKMIKEMNEICCKNLYLYKNDFTLEVFKEFIKTNSESANESLPISIKIKDLIHIQNTFCKINDSDKGSSEKEENYNENPKIFKVILNELANLKKLEELEDGSTILNCVLNFYIKPNLFFYHSDSVNIIKCQYCLLPIHNIFFRNEYVEECIYGKEWKCTFCKTSNDKGILKCKNCKKLKSGMVLSKLKTFFKKYIIPKDDELTLLYEELLYYMPVMNQSDDILLEIIKETERLKNQKDTKEVEKIELFVSFLDSFDRFVGHIEDEIKSQSVKNGKIRELNENAKKNYEKRKKHSGYLNTLKELINSMITNGEKAKSNLILNENQTNNFIKNVKNGFANSYAKDKLPNYLQKILKDDSSLEKKNTLKRFLCTELFHKKIIDEILFNNQKQDILLKKCYITFEKDENGYVIKLNFKEGTSKFFICGNVTNEFIIHKDLITNNQILEMRKTARHNPTWNSKDVRFNVFYLIKLLNQLESEK